MNQIADALMGLLGNKSDEEVTTLLSTAKAVREKRAELALLEAQLRQMTASLAPPSPGKPGRKPRGPNLTVNSTPPSYDGPTQGEKVLQALGEASPLNARELCTRTSIPYGSIFSVLSDLKGSEKIRVAATGGYELCS